MFSRRNGLSAVLACLFLVCGRASADDKKKPDDLAREAVQAFIKAVNTKDVDAAMKAVDVPFCIPGKVGVVKERDELKKHLERAAGRKNGQIKLQIEDVGTLEQLEKKTGKMMKEEKRKQLVEVLGKEHRIVLVEMTHDEGTTKAGFVVRLDGGKAFVVGIVD